MIYVRLLLWCLYSFFIGKNKKNLKKIFNFYVYVWNVKYLNGILVIYVKYYDFICFWKKKFFLIVGFICGYRVIFFCKNILFMVELLDRIIGEV